MHLNNNWLIAPHKTQDAMVVSLPMLWITLHKMVSLPKKLTLIKLLVVNASQLQDQSTKLMANYQSQELLKVSKRLLKNTLFLSLLMPATGIYIRMVFSITVD
jgi:ABC-type bacteriocin/lantibiotic exporter with double-glycine peptidase domain